MKASLRGLNLVKEDVADVALAVHRRIRTTGSPITVYVGDTGTVQMHSDRVPPPADKYKDHWLVGRYTIQAPILTIEDDLVLRRREIAA